MPEKYDNEVRSLARLKKMIDNPTKYDEYVNNSIKKLLENGISVSKAQLLRDVIEKLEEVKEETSDIDKFMKFDSKELKL